MADKLTPQQHQAVYDRGGNLLVSAAAGSGKTKVLVDRLLSYLTDPQKPANLDEFLMITYTKAAASELRGKIAAKLTERISQEPENRHLQKQMQRLYLTKISTVHGFCADILREYAYRLDLAADFRVADENETREIREVVLKDLLEHSYETMAQDSDFIAFMDTQGFGRTDAMVPELVEKVFDSSRCHLNPEQWLDSCLESAEIAEGTDAAQTVWGRFLLEDLHEFLKGQITAFRQCILMLDRCPGLEKASENMKQTLYQLETLSACAGWDETVQHCRVDFGRLTFPTKKNPDPELAEQVKAVRNACKEQLAKKAKVFSGDSAQVLLDLQQTASATRGLIALVRQFERSFRQAKKVRRVLDFGDMEHLTLDLLLGKNRTGPTAAAKEIASRFREVMVDEYQDSNGVQDAIFSVLTRMNHNCFLVGDVKQSIYQFRLADPEIFLKKYQTFTPAASAEEGCDRKVLLSHNFRSGPEIVEAVNDVFSTCMSPALGGLDYTEAEALREGIPRNPLPDAAVELHAIEIQEDSYREEARFVADRIHTMLQEGILIRGEDRLRPVQAEDIVILLRSPGSVGCYFQQALEERGIRCSSGGGNDLLRTQEIASVRSFLQVIVNPRQDIPLLSTLASPIFGFTADDLAALRGAHRKGCIYDALCQWDNPKARHFLGLLESLRLEARRQPLTRLLQSCFSATRLDSIYGAMDNGKARRENLQIFFQLAAEFETGTLRDLSQFLDFLDAMEEKGLLSSASGNAGSVSIMSIHKSKGLEFPVVFLCGLGRSFNRESLQAQILCDRELGLGLSVADTDSRIRYPSLAKRAIASKQGAQSLSEELRVLYVAMTRARDRLVMTYADRSLQSHLTDLALRMDFDGGKALCREASCPGQWVLLTAMHRREAGALHAIAGRPRETVLSDCPWRITVSKAPEAAARESLPEMDTHTLPDGALDLLKQALSFHYAHEEATRAPSKQTATQKKGRLKDEEAAEYAFMPERQTRQWRKPGFQSGRVMGKQFGNAMHKALQYIRYENCGNPDSIQKEVLRLTQEGFLTPEEGSLISPEKLLAFFRTAIGDKVRSGIPCLREFKFSVLDDSSHYGEGLEGEQVLLQGVVDCAILEEDGITVVDFKTDHVTPETLDSAVKRYRSQVQIYGEALSRIYEKPVKALYLYFFHLERLVLLS